METLPLREDLQVQEYRSIHVGEPQQRGKLRAQRYQLTRDHTRRDCRARCSRALQGVLPSDMLRAASMDPADLRVEVDPQERSDSIRRQR